MTGSAVCMDGVLATLEHDGRRPVATPVRRAPHDERREYVRGFGGPAAGRITPTGGEQ